MSTSFGFFNACRLSDEDGLRLSADIWEFVLVAVDSKWEQLKDNKLTEFRRILQIGETQTW